MTLRFISWAAVSSKRQAEEISLEDQLATNRLHAERRAGVIVGELVVPGKSRNIVRFDRAAEDVDGYYIDSDGIQHDAKPYKVLAELVSSKAFDVLIYLDRSRIGRKASLSMTVVGLCEEAGIRTYEIESPPADLDAVASADQQMIGAIKSVTAQDEIRKLTERHRKGMIGRVRKGEFPGIIPWPWKARYDESGQLAHREIQPEGKLAFDLLLDHYLNHGASARKIAGILNDAGYSAPLGGKWGQSSVEQVIRHIWRYAGYIDFNQHGKTDRQPMRVKSRWPALIDDSTAVAVDRERYERWEGRGIKASLHRFSFVVWCDVCGRRMTATTTGVKSGNATYKYKAFVCKSKTHSGGSVRSWRVEEAVEAWINHWIDNPGIAIYIDGESEAAHRERMAAKVQELRDREADLHAQIDAVDDAYFSGNLSKARYERQIARVESQLSATQNEIASMEIATGDPSTDPAQQLADLRADGLAYLTSDNIERANAFWRRHIRVWIFDNNVSRITLI